jgi:HK97 family phage major capsid protein
MAAAIPPAAKKKEPHKPAKAADSDAAKVTAGDDAKTKKPYDGLGDMLRDVARAAFGNGEANDRLVKASLNTETGADGNFLVPPDFIATLLERAEAESQLYSKATELQIAGNAANIPAVDETSRADGSRFGGIAVYWVREGSDGTYKQPKFRNLDLKLSKIMGLVSVTDEMLEDSALLASWVQQAFPAEMAFTLDQAVFDGDGNGKPLGIMNSGALVEVAAEGGQTADTIVYENIIKMWARMPARRMDWFCTQQALEQFPLMKLDVGTGGSAVFLPAGGASERPYATLMGRPIIPIEQAATLGDKGDIVLADMSDYIAITKGGLKTAQSIHVDFDKAKTSFRFIRRVNGAPYSRVALASRANAAFTTSPYITLAAR